MRSLASLVASLLTLAACGGSTTPASTLPATTGASAAGPVDAAPTTTPTTTTPPAPTPPATSDVCANRPDEFGPVLLTAELARARHGAGATTFASAPSSKAQPIEVCGVAASQRWLMTTACGDGSHPFATTMAAAQSRAGNVGPGGRCHSIIDHYVVPCPEGPYDAYVDMYMCAPDESF